MLARASLSSGLFAVSVLLVAPAALAQVPVPMTPDGASTPPEGRVSAGERAPAAPPLARSKDDGVALLIGGAIPFTIGAIQVPIGVGLAKARDDGLNVAGAVQIASGLVAVAVGIPLLIVATRKRAHAFAPVEEEYALDVGPRGLRFRGTF